MAKVALLVSSALIVLLSSFFISNQPTVDILTKVPALITGNEDFIVQVNVNKGNLSGFARLQLVLPLGYTANKVETKNAEFLVDGNVLKFIWIQLPSESSFTVSYKMKIDFSPNGMKNFAFHGDKQIGGSFSYVVGDHPQIKTLEPVQLHFSENTSEVNEQPVSIVVTPQVQRKIIAEQKTGNFLVELTIRNRNEQHPTGASFTDQLPGGYKTEIVSKQGSTFTSNSKEAMFKWTKLPADSVFKISYRLIATTQHPDPPKVEGVFQLGTETRTSEIKKGNVEKTVTPVLNTSNAGKLPVFTTPSAVMKHSLLNTSKDIYYKVQIAATYHSPARNQTFFYHCCQVNDTVDLLEQEGWKKYMVGTFGSFSIAKQFRDQLRKTIPDAFVVAYSHGQRSDHKQPIAMQHLNQ